MVVDQSSPGESEPEESQAGVLDPLKGPRSTGCRRWVPPTPEEVAPLFPNYEVLEILGRGGMGAVYKARQISLDRIVALKLLPLEVSVDEDFADRFRREARALAKLSHRHIIAVHDFGQTADGHLYFAMEFVEGANLADVIRQVGLTPEQALSLAGQICSALAYAHGKGVIHRDIKPANVMIDTDSHAKVADFGLARVTDPTVDFIGNTMTGTVMGTLGYMAPEQMLDMNVDHRADIYSLGVMLYEMLCGETPQGAFSLPSERTGCDVRIDQIVIKAMQQSPDRRYQTTYEMASAVESARLPPPQAARQSQRAVRSHHMAVPVAKPKKSPGGSIAVAILAVLAVGAIFWAKPSWLGARSPAIPPAKSGPIEPVQTPPNLATPALSTPAPPVPAPIPRMSVADAVKRLMGQKGWEDIGIATIPDDTISVHLEDRSIADLSPLAGLPVSELHTHGNPITDLGPLRGLPLRTLALDDTPVSDLSPLEDLPLRKLILSNTRVTDLSPLRDLKLVTLLLDRNAQEIDLAPLAGMTTLEDLVLPEHPKSLELLREKLPNLRFISFKWGGVAAKGSTNPAAEFWETYDAEQAAAAAAMAAPKDVSKPLSQTGQWLAEQEPKWQATFAKEVSAPFEKGVADARKQYGTRLNSKISGTANSGQKRDDAAAFRAEADQLAAGGDLPPVDDTGTPMAVKSLRTSYRQSLATVEASRLTKARTVLARHDAILAQKQTLLTELQRSDEALEIKAKRGQLAAAWLIPPLSAEAKNGPVNGLVAWWKADGNARDSIGSHHGPSVGGAGFAEGREGHAFFFAGSASSISVSGSPAFGFGDKDFSIALWAKFSRQSQSQALVSRGEGANQANQWVFWLNDGQLQWKMTGPAVSQLGSAPFAPVLGQWYRLAMTRTGDMFRFFIDGVEVSSQAWPGKIPEADGPLTLGSAGGTAPFAGLLDDIRIYNRALSALEINAVFKTGEPPGLSWNLWQPISAKAKFRPKPNHAASASDGWVRVGESMVSDSSPRRMKNAAIRARFKFVPNVQNELSLRFDGRWECYFATVNEAGNAARIWVHIITDGRQGRKLLGTYFLTTRLSAGDEYKLELRAEGDEFTVFVDDQRMGSVRDSTHTRAGLCGIYLTSGEFRDAEWRDLGSEAASP